MRSYRDPERAASFTVRFLWAQRIFVLIESAIARCHTTVHARCCNLSGTLPNQLAWMRARCVATMSPKCLILVRNIDALLGGVATPSFLSDLLTVLWRSVSWVCFCPLHNDGGEAERTLGDAPRRSAGAWDGEAACARAPFPGLMRACAGAGSVAPHCAPSSPHAARTPC